MLVEIFCRHKKISQGENMIKGFIVLLTYTCWANAAIILYVGLVVECRQILIFGGIIYNFVSDLNLETRNIKG